mmetsp:Transcript_20784/g.57703  ORF Transcript_20784/g.57703 Transcript_20784/m.57703 type:complete len:276 (-) Transcript_20784:286-1113(-)
MQHFCMHRLETVMKHYTVDFGKRMRDISEGLVLHDDACEDVSAQQGLLDELIDICESVDFARDLGKVGGLPCVLSLLSSRHEELRWRSAELLAVCAQNNLPVQKEFLEAGVLPAVLAQLRDSCEQVCVKALLALSAMVRGFYEASDAARSGGIVRQLVALASEPNSSIKSRRKSLQLLHYFCETFPEEKAAVLEEGLDAVVHCLNDTTDLDLIRAALSLSYLLLSDVSAKGKASDLLPALCKAEESLHQNFGESPDSISEEIDLVKQLKDLLLQY